MKALRLFLLLILPFSSVEFFAQNDDSWVNLYEPYADEVMPYRLMKPLGFDASNRYPVIVSLHGGGGRGTDNRKQLKVWNQHLAEEQRRAEYPCYVLAPQSERLWDGEHLERIKSLIAGLPSVDRDRIYILGHSMGGHGTNILIQIDTEYFAAAAPSAGTGLTDTEDFIDASKIKDIPIWAFHGDKDKTCPYERNAELFGEMKSLGGSMKLTTFAGDGHGIPGKMISGAENGSTQLSSDRCDPEPDFMKWLFSQKLSDRKASVASGPARNTNAARSRMAVPSDAELMERVPEGVTVELNVPYREGNEKWKLDLAMPRELAKSPRPAIVFVHGGGWTKGDKRTAAFLNQTLEYAANGYVCITVNYRLDATKLPCIEDVKCSVRWLRAHAGTYNVDPDRIGAYGNSAGAHLVTMLGVSHSEKRLEGEGPWWEYSSRVQAVVASATPTTPKVRGEADFGDALIQPMSYITTDAPPFLLFHEESDKTVNVRSSDDFVEAMKKAGAKDITYHRYTDGTGHGVFMRNIDKTGPLMETFFKRTLSP